ncbi:MAG: 16S rRNA (guanine(527)-N(7))-methyltransferase RsmG [Thermodesulfobacteriota bacterium]
MTGPAPSLEALDGIFRECGLVLPPEIINNFWVFHQLLHSRNKELDLTRIHGFGKMVLLHYVDCALAARLVDLPSPLLDIGAGAGFPGLPIKLMRPEIKVILAESRGKKLAFLEEACQTLHLSDVEIYPHKVTASFPWPVKAVITRDLEPVSRTLERAAGFLPRGGWAVFLKGPNVDAELQEALETHAADFQLREDIPYGLGDTSQRRRLLVLERVSSGPDLNRPDSAPRTIEIASVQNQNFKLWRRLLDGRGVKKIGLALLSGPKQIHETVREFPERCRAMLVSGAEDLQLDGPLPAACYRLRPELFRELDLFGTGPPLLVVEVPVMEVWDGTLPEGCTLFIPFQDPANVGAVIRAAAALGVAQAVLLEEAAHPFHPRSLRAAGPTVFRLKLLRGPSLKELGRVQGRVIVLSPRGKDLKDYAFPDSFGLAPGLEGPGLPEELGRLEAVAIPMKPGIESLNAAVATAIALYEYRRGGKS